MINSYLRVFVLYQPIQLIKFYGLILSLKLWFFFVDKITHTHTHTHIYNTYILFMRVMGYTQKLQRNL